MSFFSCHLASGQAATAITGPATSGEMRMLAQRTLIAKGLPLDRPLVLTVSREMHALFASWKRQTAIYAVLYVVVALTAIGVLLRLQRRREKLQRLADATRRQRDVGAQRLALALQGDDLVPWDIALPDGPRRWSTSARIRCSACRPATSNPTRPAGNRCCTRMTATATGSGCSSTAAASSSATPAARRMGGTHLDISQRMQIEDDLRRSEQSLAVTLNSIGDAVIATDPQGVITWLNEAADRPLVTIFRIVHATTGEPVRDPAVLAPARAEVVGLANDTLLTARDGTARHIADDAAPIRDLGGRGWARCWCSATSPSTTA